MNNIYVKFELIQFFLFMSVPYSSRIISRANKPILFIFVANKQWFKYQVSATSSFVHLENVVSTTSNIHLLTHFIKLKWHLVAVKLNRIENDLLFPTKTMFFFMITLYSNYALFTETEENPKRTRKKKYFSHPVYHFYRKKTRNKPLKKLFLSSRTPIFRRFFL